MNTWTIIFHINSIIAFLTSAVAMVKEIIKTRGVPSESTIDAFLNGLKGLFDSGLVPLETNEISGVDQAIQAIEASLKSFFGLGQAASAPATGEPAARSKSAGFPPGKA